MTNTYRATGRELKAPIAMVCVTSFFALPLLFMVVSSLRLGDPSSVFANYRELFVSGPTLRYLLNSTLVATVVVVGNILCAAAVGYSLARHSHRLGRWVHVSVLFSLMIPKQLVMIPVFLLISRLRLIDTYIALTLPFIVDAFNVWLTFQFYRSLSQEAEDAARVDGASEWWVFLRVALPSAKPILAVVAINTFLTNWNSFLYPLILTDSTSMRTVPVGLALLSQGEYGAGQGLLMAGALFLSLPVIGVYLLGQRSIRLFPAQQ